MEVKFLTPISISTNTQCISGSLYVASFTLNGGAGSALSNTIYNVSDAYNGPVNENTQFFIGPFNAIHPYNLTIEDEKGCTLTFLSDTVDCFGVLPIELLSFEATAEKQGNLINWETANELTIDYYTLERKFENQEFVKVAEIKAENLQNNKYTFLDEITANGAYIYKLTSVNINGFEEDEYLTSLNRSTILSLTYEVFPNPVKDILNINLYQLNEGKVQVLLIDMDGKTLKNETYNTNNGNLDLTYNLMNYAVGIYFIKILNGQNIETVRIIKR